MEFKGTKGKWKCIFTSKTERAIRSDGGILMTFWKPSKYPSQDERYETELKETQANQLLCSKAPEMLEMLKKAERTLREVYDCETTEINQLIKEATEL